MPILLLLLSLAEADTMRATLHVSTDGSVTWVRARQVEGDVPSLEGELQVLDAAGTPMAGAVMPSPELRRGLLTADGHLSAEQRSGLMRVALPWPEGASALRVNGQILTPPAPSIRHKLTDLTDVTPIRALGEGPSERRVDLVVLADGYTEDRRDAFEEDVARITSNLLSVEPFDHYGELFNIWSVYLPSEEASPDSYTEPGPANTPLSCAYNCDGISRLVCCDEEEILRIVDEVAPFSDSILVLTDADTFGGSGGLNYAVTFTGSDAESVSAHEIGHSLIQLWDEYPYGFAGGSEGFYAPNCAPEDAAIPWYYWLGDDNPEIGRFRSCSFSDWVRPTSGSCMMNRLDQGYCPVCREHIVRTLYKHIGARMLMDARPDAGTDVRVREGEQLTIDVDVVEPTHGLSWEWSMNGELLSTERSFSIDGCDALDGELQLVLRDDTEWVRYDPRSFLVDRITWDVKTDRCDAGGGCGCSQQAPAGAAGLLALLVPWWRRRRGRSP